MLSGHDAFTSERRHYSGDDFYAAHDSSDGESSWEDFYVCRDTSSDGESVLSSSAHSMGSPLSLADYVDDAAALGGKPPGDSVLLSLLQ